MQYHHEKPFYSQTRKIKLWVHDTDNLIIIQSWVPIEWKLTSVTRSVFFFSAFVRLLLILAPILWRFLVFMMQRFHRAQVMKYFNRLISMFLLQYVAQYPEGTSIRTLKTKTQFLKRPFQFSVNEVFRMKAEHFSFKMKVLATWKLAKQSLKTPFCSGE